MTITGKPSMTNWERVHKSIENDEPIPYDPNDPDDGPYDPNDDAAVEAYWKQATIWRGYPDPELVQWNGVPVAEMTVADIKEAYKHAPRPPHAQVKAS